MENAKSDDRYLGWISLSTKAPSDKHWGFWIIFVFNHIPRRGPFFAESGLSRGESLAPPPHVASLSRGPGADAPPAARARTAAARDDANP